MPVSNISSGNKALKFIDERIKDDRYRGIHISQHNRYTREQVINILKLLDEYTNKRNQKLMTIRTTDISKRPENTQDEMCYAQFCNQVKKQIGIGTQDAMRKNLFVDFHRMGLIERYTKKKELIAPYERKAVKFVALSSFGLRLINPENNIVETYFIFSKCVDILWGGLINILLDIFRDQTYEIKQISSLEFMFFVSAIGVNTTFCIEVDKAVELIKEFRNLTHIQREAVVETLKNKLNPDKFEGDKLNKRDFHNWHNETEQIFHILNQTIYFEVYSNSLRLLTKKGDFEEISVQLKRSIKEKDIYFQNHRVLKTPGFEVHHIIPLSWSENMHHFKLLDQWLNMLYIDGFSHAKTTQATDKKIILKTEGDNIILSDYSDNSLFLSHNENVLYNPELKEKIEKYNTDIRETITSNRENSLDI